MFNRRWKCVADILGKGFVFRVVDASNDDMILFSEWSGAQGHGQGYVWRGSLADFRKCFAPQPSG